VTGTQDNETFPFEGIELMTLARKISQKTSHFKRFSKKAVSLLFCLRKMYGKATADAELVRQVLAAPKDDSDRFLCKCRWCRE
jgi:hypothetical protein